MHFEQLARSEAMEWEEIPELYDEHAALGPPKFPKSGRAEGTPQRIEVEQIAKCIEARNDANLLREQTENTDTAKGLKNLICQSRRRLLRVDANMKMSLDM